MMKATRREICYVSYLPDGCQKERYVAALNGNIFVYRAVGRLRTRKILIDLDHER